MLITVTPQNAAHLFYALVYTWAFLFDHLIAIW